MDEPETSLIVLAKMPSRNMGKRRLASKFGDQNACNIARAMLMDTLERLSRIPRTKKVLLYAPAEARSEAENILFELSGAGKKWSTTASWATGDDLLSSR